jgi:Mrp family chromosome partitioning ATPase/capsular polysaccharide biosynthesis protein
MAEKQETTAIVTNTDRVVPIPPRPMLDPANIGPAPFDPVQLIKRSLRGRLGILITLSVLFASVGAVLGYMAEKPKYVSEGLVRIAFALPPILRETEQNNAVPMYDSYMGSQALRMTSRSVLESALTQLDGGTPPTPEMLADVLDNLTVEHAPEDEHLKVTYEDTDPYQAAIVVQAIINAFRVEYEQDDRREQEQKLAILDAHRGELQQRLADLENQAAQLSLTDAAQTHAMDQQKLMVTDQLNADETLLRGYLLQQQELSDQLQQLKQNGYLDENPRVKELTFDLDRTNHQVLKFQEECQRLRTLAPAAPGDPGAAAPAMGAPGTLEAAVPTDAGGEGFRPDPNDQTANLAVGGADPLAYEIREMKYKRIEADAEGVRKDLAETSARTEALKLESAESRLQIISNGDVPLRPFKDRRKLMSWFGATVGGCLPAAFLILLNVVRPRYRYSDETEVDVAGPAGLLGILPALAEGQGDPESAAAAAQCVHQMRVMLQVASGGRSRHYLLTSACSGEGKTSLTMALGLSFAAAGSRTLVVDCDMVGRALTRGLGASDELGLFEALGSGDPLRYIRQTHAGVWFLPAGRVNALFASKVSHLSMRRFLTDMRREFDVVLIDSGPILGSVEAATIAPEVDGVIVTVSRGQASQLVDKTTQYLRAIGAKIEGYVFNRAKHRDFHRSQYGTSARPMSSRDVLVRIVDDDADGLMRFGPLVQSVMSSLPEHEQNAA